MSQIYCVFQILDTNLSRVLASDQVLQQEHWSFFLYQMIRALKYIHSAGVIHANLTTRAFLVNEICDLKLIELTEFVLEKKKNQDAYDRFESMEYAPPEVLMRTYNYSYPVDMWCVGCIFVEMMNRKPFYSRSSSKALELICDLIGSPPFDKKKYRDLPSHSRNQIKILQQHSREPKDFCKKFPFLSKNGVDLLKRLLTFDSRERITASEALKHPFFKHLHSEQFEPLREEEISELEFEHEDYELKSEEFRNIMLQEISLHHYENAHYEYNKKILREESLMNHILVGNNPEKRAALNQLIVDILDRKEELFKSRVAEDKGAELSGRGTQHGKHS